MFLSVIIPAYNEERRIIQTLMSLKGYFSDKEYKYEILVASDGSTDDTVRAVRDFQDRLPALEIIDFKKNRGKGYVVRRTMLEAKGQLRLFMDADNSTTIDHLDKMLPYFEKGYDIVVASVNVRGAKIAFTERPYKRIFGLGSSLLIRFVLGLNIKDTQRGFKIFTAEAAEDVFKRMTVNRWGFDFEALAVAKKRGYKIKEVPIVWRNDPESKVKLGSYFKTLVELIKVRINLWKGIYEV